jgi:DNA polymerase-3 subunit alpha
MIKVGAFDSLGSRSALLKSVDKIVSLSQTEQKIKESGQTSMFDFWAQTSSASILSPDEKVEDVSITQKLDWERELLGVYFSQHPLDFLTSELPSMVTVSCSEISADIANETVVTGGMVASTRQARTRDGRPFVIATLEDQAGGVEVAVWPRLYEDTQQLWRKGNVLVVKGQVKIKEGGAQLNCHEAQEYHRGEKVSLMAVSRSPRQGEGAAKLSPMQTRRHLIININQTNEAARDVERLQKIVDTLKDYPGKDKVSLVVTGDDETASLEMPNIMIHYCPELASELSEILGEDNLRLRQELM